jgi:hypothetical protein
MILHDFKCARHGGFEGSHAICPALGCDSSAVTKVFLRAPGHISDKTKRFDAGIRKSAEGMGLSNFRSARAGEAAHGGKGGDAVLWGAEAVQKKLPGVSFAALQQSAQKDITVTTPAGDTLTAPGKLNGMRAAASSGITARAVPRAERTGVHGDGPPKAA